MIVLVDNTVLSNFALIKQIQLLHIVLKADGCVTPQVLEEFQKGVERGILPNTDLTWLTVLTFSSIEENLYQSFLQRVNAGEASCLAIAKERNGRILTDDRDARKISAQLYIPISGTLGLLVQLVRFKQITLLQANNFLTDMIAKGYRSPVPQLNTLIKPNTA